MKSTLVLGLAFLLTLPALAAERTADRVKSCLQGLKSKDGEVRLKALADAVELQDTKITAQLLKLLRDRDREVRRMAVEGLGNRSTDEGKKKAAQALADRLEPLASRNELADEYRGVIAALNDLKRPESIDALLDLEHSEPKETAKQRIMAVANCPDPKAVDALIKFLSKGRNRGRSGQRQMAVEGLRYLTGVNLGKDADKWRAWWKANRSSFDLKLVAEEREAKKREAEERAAKKRERQKKRERKKPPDDGGDPPEKPGHDQPPD